jgi:quinol monooxygenase YgiN
MLVLIQSIHYIFAPEDANKAEAMLRELRDASRKEEGVIAFDVGRSQEHPGAFALWEEYRDEAALEAHKASEHFKRLALNGVRPLAQQRIGEIVFPL